MKHYTEVDLLELCYLPPAEMIPVRKHLSECAECTLRYDGLQKKLRGAAAVSCGRLEQKPQTFWDRQRFSVMRKIQGRPGQTAGVKGRRHGLAAAAMLMLITSAVLVYRSTLPDVTTPEQGSPTVAVSVQPEKSTDAAADVFQELRAVNDPWSSEELRPFRGVVEWETWTTETDGTTRGES